MFEHIFTYEDIQFNNDNHIYFTNCILSDNVGKLKKGTLIKSVVLNVIDAELVFYDENGIILESVEIILTLN